MVSKFFGVVGKVKWSLEVVFHYRGETVLRSQSILDAHEHGFYIL